MRIVLVCLDEDGGRENFSHFKFVQFKAPPFGFAEQLGLPTIFSEY